MRLLMKSTEYQEIIWKMMCGILRPFLKWYLHLEAQPLPDIGPMMLVCNHVTNLDPLFLSAASPRKMLVFVASENILRNRPRLRRILYWAFSPISRRKGASAVDTCRKILRTLHSGRSVCLFAEGETTWNGKTGPIKSGTEVLVKAAGVPLVTYCLQGGYFTAPRWGRGIRRGKLAGVVTGVYSAEQIHSMSGEALRSVIESGIFNHACEKQYREKIRYTGHHRMDQVDSLLFLCPKCHQIGTLHGAENLVTCSCGFSSLFNDCMFPADSSPFPDLYTWDEWQTAAFADKVREEKDLEIRDSSDELVLWEIASDHSLRLAAHGALSMNRQEMVIGDLHFSLPDIRDIALLQNRKAAIAYQDRYFELHAPHVLCLRKYLLFWQTAVSSAHQL